MKLPDIQIFLPNEFLELQALITERDGMIAENMHREHCGNSIAYAEDSFLIIAEKIRALKPGEKQSGPLDWSNHATI